jgi:hypothetical protein
MGFFDFLGGGGGGASSALSDQTYGTQGLTGTPYGEDVGGMSMDVPGGATGYADPMTNPSGNPNVQLGGSQGVGLLGKLGQYVQMLGGIGKSQTPGTPGTATSSTPTPGATQAAAAGIPWDKTAPDAFAAADRDRRQMDQYANLAHDIGTTVRLAATYGSGV